MENAIKKKYNSLTDVKKALDIQSFRDMDKDKAKQFVTMLPQVNKQVAIEILNQFPMYTEFCQLIVDHCFQMCDNLLATNKEAYEQAVYAHQCTLECFANQLEKNELSINERADLSKKMVEEAEKIHSLYIRQEEFNQKIIKYLVGTIITIASFIVIVSGVKQIGTDDEFSKADNDYDENDVA